MFSENERLIFGPYFNGEGTVYADPIKVHRRLYAALEGEPSKWFERLRTRTDEKGQALPEEQQIPLPERNQAKEKVLAAAAYALDMQPFDPKSARGATENDIMAALKLYLEFRQSKKVNGQMQPSCLPCTQASAPYSFLPPGSPSPMKPTMASGPIFRKPGWPVPGKP